MSDYLWDKTGEPEEDVAQLENLLGALKHQPRPLDIPASVISPAAATAATTRPATSFSPTATIFSRPRLALAASLVLTLLAGAWLVTRDGSEPPQDDRIARVEQGSAPHDNKQGEKAVATNAASDRNPNAASDKITETPTQVQPADADRKPKLKAREETPRVVAASVSKRLPTSRQFDAKRQKLRPRLEEVMPARREEVAVENGMRWQVEQPLTAQQRAATEQLMFALRLASAKLNYAQREMQEVGRAGK